jgi:hypothetical protein
MVRDFRMLVKSYMFFTLAAEKDDSEDGRAQAQDAIAKVAAKMTPEQVAEGQRQAELYGKK